MDSLPTLSPAELNAAALETFVYQPVDRAMIRYLAKAAANVIQCDPSMMPPAAQAPRTRQPSPPREPSPRAVKSSDGALPSMEEFITQLVISSNVQVPTLMSSLVYLGRLKSRLQPMAKGLRCTTHRIFLASLILAAKYLNDSSPKNKHWANYSVVSTQAYSFGFSRTEVNLMEKQLLFLLDWDLRITDADLYRELDAFLAPIRTDVEARHLRRMRRKQEQEHRERQLHEERLARQREREEEANIWRALAQPQQQQQQQQQEAYQPLQPPQPAHIRSASQDSHPVYPSPQLSSSRASSRSRQHSSDSSSTSSHSRASSRDVSPPGLYSSSSSYAGSTTSRATTPLSEADITTAHHYEQDQEQPYIVDHDDDATVMVCDSPSGMETGDVGPCVPEKDVYHYHAYARKGLAPGTRKMQQQQMLPYEISAEEMMRLEESRKGSATSNRGVRGVLGRVFGSAR